LYRAVTGIAPHDAVDRSNAILKSGKDFNVPAIQIGKGKYSERFLKAIDHAIQFRHEDRPQTISAWRSEFDPLKATVKLTKKIPPTQTLNVGTAKTIKKKLGLSNVSILTIILMSIVTAYFLGTKANYPAPNEVEDVSSQERDIAENTSPEERGVSEEEIRDMIYSAEDDFNQGRLIEPEGENALDRYAAVLELEPDN